MDRGVIEQEKKPEQMLRYLEKEKIFAISTMYLIKNNFSLSALSALCVGYLLEVSKLGHLCFHIHEQRIVPDPSMLFQKSQKPIDSEFIMEFERAIILGLNELPDSLLQKVDRVGEEPAKPFCLYLNKSLYLHKNWIIESRCINQWQRLMRSTPEDFLDWQILQTELKELIEKKELYPEQAKAIEGSLQKNFSMICGGPGCGKTYTIAQLLKLFAKVWDRKKKKICRILLAAPTGKAAQKLECMVKALAPDENLFIEAMTVHALLQLKKEYKQFPDEGTLDADLVIIDEASMLDSLQMAMLFTATSDRARLILVGDPHQLPPIESGSFFLELEKNITGCVWRLTQALRFASSDMALFSKALYEKAPDDILTFLRETRNKVRWINLEEGKEWAEIFRFVDAYSWENLTDPEAALKMQERFRILSCLRRGYLGTEEINDKIFKSFLMKRLSAWYVPLLIVKNDHNLQLYNGMTGILEKKYNMERVKEVSEEKTYFWNNDKNLQRFSRFMLPEHEYGYALSVHKSQGSEFEKVLLVIPPGSEVFGKEMVYTAATRAKEELIILAKEETLRSLLQNSSEKISGFFEIEERFGKK